MNKLEISQFFEIEKLFKLVAKLVVSGCTHMRIDEFGFRIEKPPVTLKNTFE